MRLQDRNALVTGADSGIGQAIALTFAREGANMVIHYGTDLQGAETTAQQVQQHGVRAEIVQADLADARHAQELFAQAVAALGTIDILVNNAGTSSPTGGALQESLDDFVRLLTIDLISPFTLSQAAGKHMVERGRGVIINTTSVAQDLADPQSTSYHTAKAGLRALTESFALELAPKGIRVNSIAPGTIATPMTAQQVDDPQKRQQAEQRIPLGRVGQPQEIANMALFLASDEASYVTGVSYYVDGGLTLGAA
jgi:glucose 1-dehydrogenase